LITLPLPNATANVEVPPSEAEAILLF